MKKTQLMVALATLGFAGSALATNGYFSHGYGMKASGMAGASTTNTEDTFFGANNPAAAAYVGNRIDLGASVFSPIRETSMTGTGLTIESDQNYFPVPEFGYNRMLNPDLALGVTVYANGGMNTNYPSNPGTTTNMFGGSGRLGVDLMQVVIAPTVAYKLAPNHSVGISPLVAYQRFKADGLDGIFGPQTSENDDSFGYGVRVGYLGKITPTVTFGAAYATKMEMDEFDKYNWLFLESGDFDMPENYNIGVSWQASPAVRLVLDYQRINYSDVRSVGAPQTAGGFGWDDMDIWKLGVEYKYNKQLILRAGYSHADSPIKSEDVTFNILAPAVVEDHASVGFTYTLASGNELTVAYTHVLENEVSGPNLFGAGTDRIQMYENQVGVQYSWKM
ncbi:outer membrane protein transport protein [Thiobacillus sp.]|uniref:OmpP1/FadL family transporter n=1 Tax=Thiobacillus sp. TaxID=924 RepID=UPI00260038A1|nr:outer membrane protein transport protein [Thiobacillus sp.]